MRLRGRGRCQRDDAGGRVYEGDKSGRVYEGDKSGRVYEGDKRMTRSYDGGWRMICRGWFVQQGLVGSASGNGEAGNPG